MAHNKRIFFVGDELTAGLGDARALGWVGRVLARSVTEPPLLPIVLPFPGENISGLLSRWETEVIPRLDGETENRLVIGLGSHDIDSGLSSARSRLYLANLLDNAERMQLSPFVVGPPPRPDCSTRKLAELSASYADVCARRSAPYVDLFTPLLHHEQWNTDTSLSGSYTPLQTGYGLMAWIVLHNGWHRWLGISEREES